MRAEIGGLCEMIISLEETPVLGSLSDGGANGVFLRRSAVPSLWKRIQ